MKLRTQLKTHYIKTCHLTKDRKKKREFLLRNETAKTETHKLITDVIFTDSFLLPLKNLGFQESDDVFNFSN